MNLLIFLFGSPPKYGAHPLNFTTYGSRGSKAGYGVSGDYLDNFLQENFAPSIREIFVFSTPQFLSYPITKIVKLRSFASGGESWEAEVKIMSLADLHVKAIIGVLDIVPWCIYTKGDGWFVNVDAIS